MVLQLPHQSSVLPQYRFHCLFLLMFDTPAAAAAPHTQGTDPFSRTELTLDMVRPNAELKGRIRAHLSERGGSIMGTPTQSSKGTPKKY